MGQILATFNTVRQVTQTAKLDDVQYRIRMTWRERCQAWYFDIWLLDETPIALGRRISPGGGPLFNLLPNNAPPGYLFVRGADPYRQDQLGSEVLVIYYGADEIDEPAASDLRVTV